MRNAAGQQLALLRAPSRPRRGPVEFSVPGALARADETFAGPCRGYLPRVPGKGELVQRFVLPLELCKTTNALLSMGRVRPAPGKKAFPVGAQMAALEEKVFRMMWVQCPRVCAAPLPGRAFLRLVRFSVKEMDEGGDGMKLARDLLRVPVPSRWDNARERMTKPVKGFGFLVDDAPKYVETARWWEYAAPGFGFGLLEVWSG